MPRKVKKVKIAKDQRPKKTKKFWIILITSITLAVAAIITAVTLAVVLTKKDKNTYNYFDEVDSSYSITWNQAKKKLNDVDNVFIFYWSSDSFKPKDNSADLKLEENIEALYKAVVQYNEQDAANKIEELEFYLIDVKDKKNVDALTTETSKVTEANTFAYYYEGKYSVYPFGVENPKALTEEQQEKYDAIALVGANDLTKVEEAISFVKALIKK